MKTVTTRDLLHRTKEVRASLAMGESLAWTSHGRIVAYIQPPRRQGGATGVDWVARAKEAGTVNRGATSISSLLYGELD